MKEKFIENGIQGMDDHVILEMLLYYALPRINTNELAHRLISHFGSLADVLEADVYELQQVEGVGENTAVLIALVTQINKRYMEQQSLEAPRIHDSKDAGRYFVAKFAYETKEIAYAMFLNNKNGIISCKQIGSGVVNGTDISIRSLVETALKLKATSVIISHNHPNGLAVPSIEDEQSTKKICKALSLVGVNLLDHIIVAGDKFNSCNDLRII